MSAGSTPPERFAEVDPELSRSLDVVRGLSTGRFEVLGPLGKDREGEYAFLARAVPAGHLVVLKRQIVGAASGTNSAVLQVIQKLDASVPPAAGSCAFCHAPFSGWEPSCPDCGADVAGSDVSAATEADRERLLEAVRGAAPGYEVVGDMTRATGGGLVFFAREPDTGHLVALRLEGQPSGQGEGGGGPNNLTVAATRMMRPVLTYGSVAGSRRQNSPSIPLRSGTLGRPNLGTASGGATASTEPKVCPQCGESWDAELRFCPRDGAALRARERTEDLVGQVIAERYHIIRMLGEGGMGRVYLAEHVRMGRTCAVKVMNPKLLYDPDSVSRFSREAANASRITHPNVAAIYDFGESDDIVYLAMEYVDGPSLAGVLTKERRLSEERVIAIGAQVADALTAAHDFGIVHRDLKPDNVMLTRSRAGEDRVKVVDFGIAKATQGGQQTVTRTGFVIGTPAYMSPEQILGDVLDGRSDIYSLGCILYEMLTGERVFAGSSGEVSIHQRLSEPAPRPRLVQRDVSKGLDDVVNKALARSPAQRFQTASELRSALVGALDETEEEPSSSSATTVLRHRSTRSEGPRPGPVLAVCAGLVAVGVAGWIWLIPHRGGSLPEPAKIPITPTEPVATTPAPAPPSPVPADTATAKTPSTPSAEDSGTLELTGALPDGARVIVDGKTVSVSADGTMPLAPGRHTVAVRAPGFRAFSQSVRVTSGQTESLAPQLVPAEPVAAAAPARPAPTYTPPAPAPAPSAAAPAPVTSGTIAIQGDLPEGAALDVDGRPLAIGVRSVTATPGPHWVRVSIPGYRSDSSQVTVSPGQESSWTAPRLVAIVKAAPAPALPKEPPAGQYSSPKAPPPAADEAQSESQVRAEVVTLLSDYEKAINARDLGRLKTLFPGMSADIEKRWKDLFGKDVNDLKAAVTLVSIVPASAVQIATFKLLLTFKPTGGKQQKYQLTNVGTVRHEAAGWRFLDLVESGS